MTGGYDKLCHVQEGGASGFQDNDSLAKELAKELNADLLVLLTNVDGLLDGPPKDRTSKWVNPLHTTHMMSCLAARLWTHLLHDFSIGFLHWSMDGGFMARLSP